MKRNFDGPTASVRAKRGRLEPSHLEDGEVEEGEIIDEPPSSTQGSHGASNGAKAPSISISLSSKASRAQHPNLPDKSFDKKSSTSIPLPFRSKAASKAAHPPPTIPGGDRSRPIPPHYNALDANGYRAKDFVDSRASQFQQDRRSNHVPNSLEPPPRPLSPPYEGPPRLSMYGPMGSGAPKIPRTLPEPSEPFKNPESFIRPSQADEEKYKLTNVLVQPVPLPKRNFMGFSDLTETYEVQEKLGEGTFGVVRKATVRADAPFPPLPEVRPVDDSSWLKRRRRKVYTRLPRRGQMVALKQIIFHSENDGMPLTALREIRILKSLDHRNIVPLLDIAYGKGDVSQFERGKTFMVFPYMDHDLSGLLENRQVTLTVSQIKLYALQLLEGTHYLHKNNVLHRDMKAANLLINHDGVLMIADFGLARTLQPEDRDYTACVVTRWYRPPEILLGDRRYGTAIDMWGIGCIIGEMFKRRPIFAGTTDLNQCQRIFEICGAPDDVSMPGYRQLPGCENVREWSRHRPALQHHFQDNGPELINLLERLLTLDPKRRISALDAISHEFFWTNPLPADPSKLPTWSASHEMNTRRRVEVRPHPSKTQPSRPSPMVTGGPNGLKSSHPLPPQPCNVPIPPHVSNGASYASAWTGERQEFADYRGYSQEQLVAQRGYADHRSRGHDSYRPGDGSAGYDSYRPGDAKSSEPHRPRHESPSRPGKVRDLGPWQRPEGLPQKPQAPSSSQQR